MTANYNFQHNVLRQTFELLPNRELKSIIITQDTTRAREIFFAAMQKSHMDLVMNRYAFKCDFIIKNNLPILVYYFDGSPLMGPNIVGECFAAVIVATKKNHYYTIEYSFENNFVIGQSENGSHRNYGFYPNDNMDAIIDCIIKRHADNEKDKQDLTDDSSPKDSIKPTSLIASIQTMQKTILITLSVLLVLAISFPIIAAIAKNNIYGPYSSKLTSMDANQKVYCTTKDGIHRLYVRENGQVNLYKFSNQSMYNSSQKVVVGRATSVQLREYFGANLVSGTPSVFYMVPVLSTILIVTIAILIISLVFMCVHLHKLAQAILFTVSRQNDLFIKNKKAFEDEIISKYEYNKIQKSLLSQKILKNKKLFNLFQYLY